MNGRYNEGRARMWRDAELHPVLTTILLLIGVPTFLSFFIAVGVLGILTLVSVFRAVTPYLGASICIATVVGGIAYVWSIDLAPRPVSSLLISFMSLAVSIVLFILDHA